MHLHTDAHIRLENVQPQPTWRHFVPCWSSTAEASLMLMICLIFMLSYEPFIYCHYSSEDLRIKGLNGDVYISVPVMFLLWCFMMCSLNVLCFQSCTSYMFHRERISISGTVSIDMQGVPFVPRRNPWLWMTMPLVIDFDNCLFTISLPSLTINEPSLNHLRCLKPLSYHGTINHYW